MCEMSKVSELKQFFEQGAFKRHSNEDPNETIVQNEDQNEVVEELEKTKKEEKRAPQRPPRTKESSTKQITNIIANKEDELEVTKSTKSDSDEEIHPGPISVGKFIYFTKCIFLGRK